eukprot:2561085-Prymnesium_polylepis.1
MMNPIGVRRSQTFRVKRFVGPPPPLTVVISSEGSTFSCEDKARRVHAVQLYADTGTAVSDIAVPVAAPVAVPRGRAGALGLRWYAAPRSPSIRT